MQLKWFCWLAWVCAVKYMKELLQPVYFHVACKHWLLAEHNLGHRIGGRLHPDLGHLDGLEFSWNIMEHGNHFDAPWLDLISS